MRTNLRAITSYAKRGITPSYTNDKENSVIVLNQKCNRNFTISLDEARFHDSNKKGISADKLLKPFDVLINATGVGTAGRIAQIKEVKRAMTTDSHMLVLRCIPQVDKKYYGWLLKSYQQIIETFAEGSTGQTEMNKDRVLDLEFDLPPLATQRKIASILNAIDDKIELNNRMNENLEEQAKSIYDDWFKKYSNTGGIKPSNWAVKSIYEIADVIYGAPFASKLFNSEGKGTPIIRIRDLKNQEFSTFTTEKHPKGYMLKKGDIVVGMDGEFKPYIWGNESAWLNQRVCVFNNKRCNGKFFLYFTIIPQLKFIESTEAATTVIHIGKNDFDKFVVEMPDDDTLNKYDKLTDSMFNTIVKNMIENKHLAELRDTLLPKLMSGEIDVDAIEL